MYYKGTYQECLDYDNQVIDGLGLINGDNWANPIEIDGSWYILKHDNYSTDLELVNELPPQNLEII